MRNINIKTYSIFLKYWSRWSRRIRFFSIFLIIAILTIINSVTPSVAQIGFFPSPNSETHTTPWWDVHKAKLCGRHWCSIVFLHMEEETWESLLVASQGKQNQSSIEVALEIEERARIVQRTLSQIFRRTAFSPEMAKVKPQKNWTFFLDIVNKPLHPATPQVAVGIENGETVIFVPAQPELQLSQQTIITVNQTDASANGKSIDNLAQSWRDLIQRYLSEKLWGYEQDTNYPWLRTRAASVIAGIALIGILVLGLISQVLKKLERKIRKTLSRLTESLAIDPQSASARELVKLEELNTLTSPAESIVTKSEENSTSEMSSVSVNNSETPDSSVSDREADKSGTLTQLDRISIFNFWQKAIAIREILATQMETFGEILPKTSGLLQIPLKQIQNLTQLLIRLQFWGQIYILLMSVALILMIFPAVRSYYYLFAVQAIYLPLTWMLVSIISKIFDIFIDYSLNQWAKEAQLNAPPSNRYTARVSTYSPLLKKATTLIFVSIGIYITVLLLGINPTVLAGAGFVAVALAFLSRNLLENMLNGILILVEDRYAIGDVIEVNGMGGCVENMNLFTTRLRNLDGQLIIIPNSFIGTVINMTKDWSRVNFSIKVAYDTDINKAKELLQQVADQMQKESEWQDKILETATILGVDEVSHEGILIRMLIKTAPSQQWAVAREIRLRVQREFIKAGISLGIPQRAIWQISPHLSKF